MTQESIKVTGKLMVEHFRDGVLIDKQDFRDNIVTTVGKNAIATLFNATTAGNALVTHMGFGTGTTAVAVGDTALTTELSGSGYARVAVTRTIPTAGTIQYVSTLTGLTAATTIQEAGLFNAATAGALFAHQLTGAVNLATASDSIQVTWQVTFA